MPAWISCVHCTAVITSQYQQYHCIMKLVTHRPWCYLNASMLLEYQTICSVTALQLCFVLSTGGLRLQWCCHWVCDQVVISWRLFIFSVLGTGQSQLRLPSHQQQSKDLQLLTTFSFNTAPTEHWVARTAHNDSISCFDDSWHSWLPTKTALLPWLCSYNLQVAQVHKRSLLKHAYVLRHFA